MIYIHFHGTFYEKNFWKIHGIIKLKWYKIIIIKCKLISWKKKTYIHNWSKPIQLDPYKNSMILKQHWQNWSQKVYLSLTLTDFLGTLRYNLSLSLSLSLSLWKLRFILKININYEQIPIDFLKQSWIFSTRKSVSYVVIFEESRLRLIYV